MLNLVQLGHFVYEGRGAYQLHKIKRVAKHFSMLAGGTGEWGLLYRSGSWSAGSMVL